MGRLSGKVALVTGAARGQGAAHARAFCLEGAAVVLSDVDDDLGIEVARALVDQGAKARYVRLDVANVSHWEDAVGSVIAEHGRLDVLVNNAGIVGFGTAIDTTDEAWSRMIAINQTGVFYGMRAVLPHMVRAGQGAIINVASTFAVGSGAGYLAYQASKRAVIALTESAACSHAQEGVRVNAVCPGLTLTEMVESASKAQLARLLEGIPAGRGAAPEEISAGVAFLASDEASYVNGATLVIDGGLTANVHSTAAG